MIKGMKVKVPIEDLIKMKIDRNNPSNAMIKINYNNQQQSSRARNSASQEGLEEEPSVP